MRYFFILVIFLNFLNAKTLDATYKITFGIFGEIGTAKTTLKIRNNNTYKIDIHAYTTGLTSVISGGREEWFSSVGTISNNGLLIPNEYKKIVQRKKNVNNELIIKKDIKRFEVSHMKQKVVSQKMKYEDEKLKSEVREELKYYAQNDLLSLFFNFKNLFKSLEIIEPMKLTAIGANKKDGKIDILPVENTKILQEELSWKDGVYLKVVINDKIFTSQKGELLVNLNKEGIAQSAVLKDVIFFGDIRGDLVE